MFLHIFGGQTAGIHIELRDKTKYFMIIMVNMFLLITLKCCLYVICYLRRPFYSFHSYRNDQYLRCTLKVQEKFYIRLHLVDFSSSFTNPDI